MAADRAGAYESKFDSDGIEALTKKLTADLRKHIRALAAHEVLSPRWMQMAQSLARIGFISQKEAAMPKDKADSTLWECEELALRYLLEDGKLNLCLRLLEQYRTAQQEVAAGTRSVTEEQTEAMAKFEKGISELLKNAWMHAEALQTTDLPLLITHTGAVLGDAAETEFKESQAELLPAVSIHFVLALGTHLDSIDESRVMPLIMKNHVIKSLILHVAKNRKMLPDTDVMAAAEAMSLLADSEEFSTFPDRYLEDDDTKRALISWKDLFLSAVTEDRDVRRKLRPLIDLVNTAERKMLK